jgi:diguanylate cyclase (GGDEF)-like protein
MIFQRIRKTVREVTSQPLEVNLKALPALKSVYMSLLDWPQDKDKQLYSLKRAYIGAFSIIAAISILSHIVTAHITSNEKENAKVTVTITHMRSLVETIVSQATVFRTTGDVFDDNLITGSIDALKEDYAKIETYGDDAAADVLQNPRYLLNKRLATFIQMGDDFLKYNRIAKRTEAKVAFDALTGDSSKALEINLDLALEQYRSEILEEIKRDANLQKAGIGIILLVLALEMLFIFNPLVKRLEEYHKHLIKLALTDMLTDLNNRRAFMQLANAGLDYYKRHKTPFVLVLMDLDHFKSVNDTYGHKVGDLVLQHYSDLMKKSLRAHDTIGRIGGEEFAIFLPQITPAEAMPLLERCRKSVAETPCPYIDGNGEKKTLSYTSSFGAVSVSEGQWTLDELFIRADEQLYKAKEKSRNCIVLTSLDKPKPAGASEPAPAAPAPAAQPETPPAV